MSQRLIIRYMHAHKAATISGFYLIFLAAVNQDGAALTYSFRHWIFASLTVTLIVVDVHISMHKCIIRFFSVIILRVTHCRSTPAHRTL